jgi:hypothetical protein
MSQYVATSSLNGVVAAPIIVPQVAIPAQSAGLPIAQFQLLPGQVMSMVYLSVHFINFMTLGFTERRHSGLPIVYAGIYYQTGSAEDTPLGRPILFVGRDIPGVGVMRRSMAVNFTEPGLYRVLLVNNHASSTISALVTGTAQIFNVTTQNG